MRSYLKHRFHYVSAQICHSSRRRIEAGVPEGSELCHCFSFYVLLVRPTDLVKTVVKFAGKTTVIKTGDGANVKNDDDLENTEHGLNNEVY